MRTQLGRASASTKLWKILRALLAVAFFVAISAAIGGWVAYLGYAVFSLIFIFLVRSALAGGVAPCPTCGAPLGANSDGEHVLERSDEPMTLCCECCGEYLTLLKGEVQLHAPTITDWPTFKSRAFENGVWPDGCVLCGDHPTRHEALGALKGVPYCGSHTNAVRLELVDDQLQLTWRSLPMLRKYLAANQLIGPWHSPSHATRSLHE